MAREPIRPVDSRLRYRILASGISEAEFDAWFTREVLAHRALEAERCAGMVKSQSTHAARLIAGRAEFLKEDAIRGTVKRPAAHSAG